MNTEAQKFLERNHGSRETCEWIEAMINAECDVWPCLGLIDSRRDGFDYERRTRLHPDFEDQRVSYVTPCLDAHYSPVTVVTGNVIDDVDEMCGFIAGGRHCAVLCTDGDRRRDTCPNPRNFFRTNRRWIAHAAVADRARRGDLAERRARSRELKIRSGHAESVDGTSGDVQRPVLTGRARVNSISRGSTSGSDLSW